WFSTATAISTMRARSPPQRPNCPAVRCAGPKPPWPRDGLRKNSIARKRRRSSPRSWRSLPPEPSRRFLRRVELETAEFNRRRATRQQIGSGRSSEEVIDRLKKPGDRDRLRQIGLAAALQNFLLVAFHRKGGDRDDGNGAQLFVVLQPLCDLEPRYLRQLDVHENEVRPIFARQLHGFDSVTGLHDAVAAGLDEIVEELHVKLVVFNDEHDFGHRLVPPRQGRLRQDGNAETLTKGELLKCAARQKQGYPQTARPANRWRSRP